MDRLPTHEQLLIFSAIAKHGSFISAARMLNLPTSTLGRKLSALEEMLEARLFHRSTRSVALSNDGYFYLQEFSVITEELERVRSFLSQSRSKPEGALKLTTSFSYGISKLASVLTNFQITYPEVKIQLNLRNEYEDIVAEGYDLALSLGPLKDSSLVAKKIDSIHYCCVASKKYLDACSPITRPDQLTDHKCITLSLTLQPTNWTFNHPLGEEQVRITPVFAANDPTYALEMVKLGAGIAYLPNFLVDHELGSGSVVAVLPEWQNSPRNLYAVYHHRTLMPLSLKLLLQHLEGNLIKTNNVIYHEQ